ncbi:MAG: hypothetical protein FJ100_20025 [Deltaproteobacteria bacterium]|nr:hypothetical protein [Deltaproteobacteria bacterium]
MEKADLWAEAAVGPNKVVLPRAKVGAVPYALEADSAKVAGTALAASSAVGALQQEIAALKAKVDASGGGGSGGGFGVYDGAGVYLGKLLTVRVASDGNAELVFWTATGHKAGLYPSGKASSLALYFSGKNCTGDAYASGAAGLVGYGYMQPKTLAYSSVLSQWLVTAPWGGDAWKAIGTTQPPTTSHDNGNGLCINNASGSSLSVFAKFTKITAAEAGLPDSIAPGLVVKAL